MVDEEKYSKFTPSAKEELESIIEKYKEQIINKAYYIAEERQTANREVGLRDVIEANRSPKEGVGIVRSSIRQTKLPLVISFLGLIYAFGGIALVIVRNKDIIKDQNFGFIIFAAGICLMLFGVFYNLIFSPYKLKVATSPKVKFNEDFEIVKKWQIIEELAKKSISNTDKDELKLNSVSFLIRYLSHKIAKDEIEYLKIRKLLLTRNKILHENYKLDDNERKELLDFANELIERLEIVQKQDSIVTNTLQVISATYGTPEKSTDATSVLNQLINNNTLEFVVNNELVGDPDFGKVKQLNILYKIGDIERSETYIEGVKVIIPE
jgi:hypothetical protein